jgi:hypothetical protein
VADQGTNQLTTVRSLRLSGIAVLVGLSSETWLRKH